MIDMTDEKKADELYIEWDESEITEGEVERRMQAIKDGEDEEVPHCSACGGMIDIKGKTDKEIEEWVRNAVYSDDWLMTDAWECFLEGLQELMDKCMDGSAGGSFGKSYFWSASAENIGWQHRSGEKVFRADTAKELLEQLLPKTNQYTLRVYDTDGKFTIRCAHHDAPTGEFYYVQPDEICCVCHLPREGKEECECICPTHGDLVFSDPTIGDHNECLDCHKKRLNGEIKDEED